MRIGLELLTTTDVPWRDLRDAARSMEDAGFDSVWVPDHLEKPLGGRTLGFYDALTTLAGLAEATSRMRIGASVSNASLRHPYRLAHTAVTLDEISGGRFTLGLGSGGRGYEYRFLGVDDTSGFARLAESVAVIAPLLRGEEATVSGAHWVTEQSRLLGAERRDIPLMIGASGPRAIDLAFRHAHEWNVAEIVDPSPERVAERVALADAAQARHGRVLQRSLDVMVAPDPTQRPPALAPTAITGSPEEIADRLLAFAHLGFDEVHCYGPAPSQPGGAGWPAIIERLHAA